MSFPLTSGVFLVFFFGVWVVGNLSNHKIMSKYNITEVLPSEHRLCSLCLDGLILRQILVPSQYNHLSRLKNVFCTSLFVSGKYAYWVVDTIREISVPIQKLHYAFSLSMVLSVVWILQSTFHEILFPGRLPINKNPASLLFCCSHFYDFVYTLPLAIGATWITPAITGIAGIFNNSDRGNSNLKIIQWRYIYN